MRCQIVLIVLLFIIMNIFPMLSSAGTSSIYINEVELNPEGDDSGNEWVELYNMGNEDITLTGYYFENSDGDRYVLSGLVKANGFKVVTFSTQYLDNENETVILFDENDNKIDETPTLEDKPSWGSGDSNTWSRYPDGSDNWEFREETRGKINKPQEIVNNKPLASFTMTPISGKVGEVITVDASNSKDLDGDKITFEWDWGDGSAKTTGETGTHTYSKAMYYTITLTVMDEHGLEDVETKRIRIIASDTNGSGDDEQDDSGGLLAGCGALILIIAIIALLILYFVKFRKKKQIPTSEPKIEISKSKKKKRGKSHG